MAVSVARQSLELTFEPLNLVTKYPFGISYGTSSDTRNILVRIKYGDLEGLGEAAPTSYHGESPATVMSVLTDWKLSGLIGDNPFAIEAVCKRLDQSIAGNCAAKAAVEMALYDLQGKLLDVPVSRLLGLEGLKAPITDFTIGIDSLDVIEKKTREAVEQGYLVLKVKQGTPYDREIIKKIRAVAPEIPLRVDANGGWTVKQAIVMSSFLAEHNVEFIEQPLPKFASAQDFKTVRENSPLPIFADESIGRSIDVARLAGAIDGVVVKLAKTGGLAEALKVIHTARAHSLKIMFGCMIESSLGVTAAATLAPLVDYLDLDGALLLDFDPFIGASYTDGYMVVPPVAGLGVVEKLG